jgi:hypothetical protein
MTRILLATLEDIEAISGSGLQVKALPVSGKELEPGNYYIAKLSGAEARKLDGGAVKNARIELKVEATGHNLTVEANEGQTIEGKASVEVGTGAGAANNSQLFTYDGEGTWWLS